MQKGELQRPAEMGYMSWTKPCQPHLMSSFSPLVCTTLINPVLISE